MTGSFFIFVSFALYILLFGAPSSI